MLEALGKPAGPEDLRTVTQRRHDALEEACRRLIAAQMVPGRAGQPTQALVHITLAQLRTLPGASGAEAAWRAAAAARGHGWLSGPDAGAAACDATVAPVVTGHVDPAALDRLTEAFLALHGHTEGGGPGRPGMAGRAAAGAAAAPARPARRYRRRRSPGCAGRCWRWPPTSCPARAGSPPGCASRSSRPARRMASLPLDVPLPLDAGEAGPAIPAHLRRAATARHPHCAFPGCGQPASVCQIHHLIPRSAGGPTALRNLVPLCAFHHLIVIHRWGWTLTLHPDGTTTATSPDGRRTYHSHGPPTPATAHPATARLDATTIHLPKPRNARPGPA